MLKPGDQWGNVDVTNPSYFAPAYYRVFGQVTGKTDDWNKVISANYDILEKSLNATSGNARQRPGACLVRFVRQARRLAFLRGSHELPERLHAHALPRGPGLLLLRPAAGQSYLAKISSFYAGLGVSKIVDGYDLDGTPKPDKAVNGLQAASFVGPAGVGAMSDAQYQSFINDAYAAVATLNLTAGTIYYQKSWTALSLLMMTANLVDFTQMTQ
jgi:hypothetical protein